MIEFPRFPKKAADYSAQDIAVVIGVRLGEFNPWVLPRLSLLCDYYEPRPNFLVVDFGSSDPWARKLEACCEESGLSYRRVEDVGTYSNGIARNCGFTFTDAELLFFTDVDFFMSRDAYGRMAALANTLELSRFRDVILTMPAWHLSEARTEEFNRLSESGDRSTFLEKTAFLGAYSSRQTDFEFVAPYSNNFLCRRELYDRLGGYSDEFRGHGSEDFEFFIRYALTTSHLPLPANLFGDFFGPLKPSYYRAKPYEGFRRLLELLTLPSEMAGLRAIHLYHPTASTSEWVSKNDWKRSSFKSVTAKYGERKSGILKVDSLPRVNTFVCVVKHPEHWRYFLPLRAAGIRLLPVSTEDEIAPHLGMMLRGEVDGVAVFNPYMKSHLAFRALFDAAVERGIERIVVERGALPGSLYYAEDVSYNDPEFLQLNLDALELSSPELDGAREYTSALRQGSTTLEENGDPLGPEKKYAHVRAQSKRLVFIPLQLSDDMAVTQYTQGKVSYAEFVSSIDLVARLDSAVTYLVKKHPLSKEELEFSSSNVTLCDEGDNVHALIELSDAVVCYNSGVGVLALAHRKPVFTVGNAYYLAKERLGKACATLETAAKLIAGGDFWSPSARDVDAFFAWLLYRKYSYFTATDEIRDFGDRKAHDYKDIHVESLRLKGERFEFETCLTERAFGEDSYAAGHLSISLAHTGRSSQATGLAESSKKGGTTRKKLRKFIRDPGGFFADSKFTFFRALGSRFSSK